MPSCPGVQCLNVRVPNCPVPNCPVPSCPVSSCLVTIHTCVFKLEQGEVLQVGEESICCCSFTDKVSGYKN